MYLEGIATIQYSYPGYLKPLPQLKPPSIIYNINPGKPSQFMVYAPPPPPKPVYVPQAKPVAVVVTKPSPPGVTSTPKIVLTGKPPQFSVYNPKPVNTSSILRRF